VFLFYLQLLEQPVGAPGCNDPVYLYGTLYGPYPDAGTQPLAGIEGQLTITRGDLLAGLAGEAAHAFHYEKTNVKAAPHRRCFHLVLHGDNEEEPRCGRGVVLAYPLLPVELITDDVANELVVSRLLYDLLNALKEDLAREGVDHPLRSQVLPVPDRSMLEQQLIAQGYAISGDKANKKVDAGRGLQGRLASVLGALMNEQLALPPEGGVDDFLALAGRALEALAGWPSPRAVALRNLVQPALARRSSVPRYTPQINIPQASAPSPPSHSGTRPQAPYRKPSVDTAVWMQDFIAAHRQPHSPPPRLTAISDWTKDFAQDTASIKKRERDSNPPSEWMEDFE